MFANFSMPPYPAGVPLQSDQVGWFRIPPKGIVISRNRDLPQRVHWRCPLLNGVGCLNEFTKRNLWFKRIMLFDAPKTPKGLHGCWFGRETKNRPST